MSGDERTSAEVNARLQARVEAIIDEIIDEYRQNNAAIFHDESERAAHHYRFVNESRRSWSDIGQCTVSSCGNRSVQRSHTVPLSMSLATIAEDGHLVAPEFDHESGHLKIAKVGIRRASTFPGFCTEHESLFGGFEREGQVVAERDVILQAYRAACRERYRLAHHLDHVRRMVADYQEFRDRRLLEKLQGKLGPFDDVQVKRFSMPRDPLIDAGEPFVNGLRSHLTMLDDAIIPGFEKELFDLPVNGDVYILQSKLGLQVPVAMSGATSFEITVSRCAHPVLVLLNVVPTDDDTIILLAGLGADRKYIEQYVHRWSRSRLEWLSMIESWMVSGSDQWYLSSSAWERLSSPRQRAILDAILRSKDGIWTEYQSSILDTVREKLLAALVDEQIDTPECNQLIAKEQAKLEDHVDTPAAAESRGRAE